MDLKQFKILNFRRIKIGRGFICAAPAKSRLIYFIELLNCYEFDELDYLVEYQHPAFILPLNHGK